jgi:hypothetical protein
VRSTWPSPPRRAPNAAGPVFRPVTNKRTKELDRPLNPNSIYRNIVLKIRP